MRKAIPFVVIVAVVVVAVVLWNQRHHATDEATSGSGSVAASSRRTDGPHVPATPASVSGRVTRASDGAGIAGAVVVVASSDFMAELTADAPPQIVVSDATGAWTAPKVAPGGYVITANATGYLPKRLPKLSLAPGEQHGGVEIVLAAGGTLVHGTVTDVGGGPIAGAHVSINLDVMELSRSELVAITGTDGTYQLSVADGEYGVSAHHDDYTSASHQVEVAGKPVVLDFVLTPGGVIHGVVIARDTGKPVPNAMVRVHSHFDGGTATTDADGAFTLRGVHAGTAGLSAAGRGYASATPTTVQIGIGEQLDGVRVMVEHALSIRGTVVKKGTHVGLAGIQLGAFSISARSQAMAPQPSDANGNFEIVGVRPATYLLFAFGDNTVPDVGKSVPVVDKDVTGVEIEMSAGATISGRVEPPQVATLTVELAGEVGLANMMEAMKTATVHGESDASGAFVLHNVPTGALKLRARTTDGHTGTLPLAVGDADQNGVVVQLEARASLSGRVVDTDNTAVEGIDVYARATEESPSKVSISFGGSSPGGAKSAADGTFKMVGLDPGKYDVGTYERDEMFTTKKGEKKANLVDLTIGTERTGVVVTVEARNGVIHGKVISAHDPAPDAWVTAHRERPPGAGSATVDGDFGEDMSDVADRFNGSEPVLTGADGTFAIRKLKHGTYRVVVEGPRGGSHAEQTGVKPGDSITLELQPLGTLTGHVTSAGTPVVAYEISCHGLAGSVDRDFAAADGAYTLDHLAPGSYDCKATSSDGNATGKVDVPAGSAQLELAITPWSSLTGVVVSMFSGAPVPGIAAFTAMDQQAIVGAITGTMPTTDATGRFTLDRVATGSGSVMIMNPTSSFGSLASRPYSVTPGQHLDLGTIKIVPPRQGDAGTLGMSVEVTDNAVMVTAVKPGGPADAAGVHLGDKVVSIDGRTTTDLGPPACVQFLSSGQIGIGETVLLGLDRGGATIQASVTSVKW